MYLRTLLCRMLIYFDRETLRMRNSPLYLIDKRGGPLKNKNNFSNLILSSTRFVFTFLKAHLALWNSHRECTERTFV